MIRKMKSNWLGRPAAALVAAAFLMAGIAGNALGATDIGGAAVVVNEVTGLVEGSSRAIEPEARVYQDDIISTGAASATELQFLDGSMLTMGEGSQVELTDVIFDPDPALSKVVLTLSVGILSFVTGELDFPAYEVLTPSATIGVRGTVFTVMVINGVTTVTVTSGVVTVTAAGVTVTIGAGLATTVLPGLAPAVPAAPSASMTTAMANMNATVSGAGGAAGTTGAAGAASGGIGAGAAVGVGVAAAAAIGVGIAAVTSDDEEVISTTTTTSTTN